MMYTSILPAVLLVCLFTTITAKVRSDQFIMLEDKVNINIFAYISVYYIFFYVCSWKYK